MTRRIVERLMPPALLDAYRAISGRRHSTIWEGIYADFSDVPKAGKGYSDGHLEKEIFEHTQSLLNAVQKNEGQTGFGEEDILLPLVTSVVLGQRESVSIVDFGGGMGIGYIRILENVPESDRIDYSVIELENICRKGEELFRGHRNIRFVTAIPNRPAECDIVYLCSSLQYVDKYKEALNALIDLSPKFVLMAKLSAGNNPTFVTSQRNLRNSSVPYRFFNAGEIIDLFSTRGYTLIHRSRLQRTYDQDNFPLQYRMNRACNLLFARKSMEGS